MRIFIIIFIAILSLNAQATVTISSVGNASNEVNLTPSSENSSSTIEIMGGISGAIKCVDHPGITTILNSCNELNDRSACNQRTICNTTELQIRMKSDNTNGKIVVVNEDNQPVDFDTTTSYTSGQDYTISIPWENLCQEIIGDDCEEPSTDPGVGKVFKIGVDSNNDDLPDDSLNVKIGVYAISTDLGGDSLADGASGLGDGITQYSLFPGDQKAYITEMEAVGSYSAEYAAKITRIRGFFAETNCTDVLATPTLVNNGSDSYYVDIDSSSKEITDNRIDEGLSNNKTYVFMFGFEDKAGNIGLFKDLANECIDDQHSVMPREVNGLLENNQNCFISTAAFGSPLNAKVKTFRKFRDEYLNKFSLGQKFVQFYYKNSPPVADAIRENIYLKKATQIILWPAWAVSAAVLYMGFMPFMFVVTMTLLSFVFLRERKSKKKSNQTFLIFFLVFAGLTASEKTFAQDDFFSTETKSSAKESAPNEPPYNGTENDEFSDLENSSQESIQSEEEYQPEIASPTKRNNYGTVKESPDKWKPYQRVPEEKRLEELSEQGLMKITKKGGYLYKVKPSEQKSAASFRFSMASFPNLQNPSSGTNFTDIYGEDKKPMLMMDYEWQFFQSFGKLGLKVGSGLMMASGKGQFNENEEFNNSRDAMEKYSFYMFPNSLAAIYRLDIFDKQWIVPFAEVGVDYLGFIEMRDDGADFKFGGAPHMHFAIGGSFLLDVLGRDMMAEIDSQYGVNHLWLTAEYRRLESLGSDFDFSDDVINGGIMVEF